MSMYLHVHVPVLGRVPSALFTEKTIKFKPQDATTPIYKPSGSNETPQI